MIVSPSASVVVTAFVVAVVRVRAVVVVAVRAVVVVAVVSAVLVVVLAVAPVAIVDTVTVVATPRRGFVDTESTTVSPSTQVKVVVISWAHADEATAKAETTEIGAKAFIAMNYYRLQLVVEKEWKV